MKLSKKGEYALKAVVYLSCKYINGDREIVTIHEISRHENIPEKFLQGILLNLKKVGLLQSHRGINGGYTLNREPAKITIGEVVRIIDGPLAPVSCVSKTAHVACVDENRCRIQSVMVAVRDAISGVLDKITFEDMCKRIYGVKAARV